MSSDDKGFSRRDFLRTSATAAAALSVNWGAARAAEQTGAAAVPAADVPPVLFGIIGTGAQGCNDLTQAVQVPGVKCVAVCDIYPPNQKKGLAIAKGAEAYDDYRKMLERKDMQAVMICTPLGLHAPMVLAALDAGKHVFVEKTMALTVDLCRQIVQRSRTAKKHVQVGQQRHYSPLYHHALDQIQKGLIGDITAVRAFWNRNGSPEHSSWWRTLKAEEEPKFGRILRWRLYKQYSGGLMTELACHQFDAINWFLGTRPIAVQGVGNLDWYKEGGRDVFDTVHVVYEYPNGVKVTYQSLSTNAYEGEGTAFYGRKGTMIITERGGSLYPEGGANAPAWAQATQNKTKDDKGHSGVVLDATATTKEDKRGATAGVALAGGGSGNQNSYYLELADFFEVVRNPDKKKPFADAELGLQVAATVLRANEAMEKGTRYVFTKKDFEV